MTDEVIMDLDETKFKICIIKLRDVLNEMCFIIDESELSVESLTVSHKLDQLLVEYMNLKNKYRDLNIAFFLNNLSNNPSCGFLCNSILFFK